MKLLKKKQKHEEGAPSGAPLPLPTETSAVVRVRILRKAFTAWGFVEPGRVVRVPAHVAQRWIAEGLAEQDKALDGPQETK